MLDRDTQGVPGSPDIASTIFAKITAADVFVADISIIGASQSRPTPNPNVLIELGYALKAMGHERVILVFNKAFGKIEDLPFDLRMRRVLATTCRQTEPRGRQTGRRWNSSSTTRSARRFSTTPQRRLRLRFPRWRRSRASSRTGSSSFDGIWSDSRGTLGSRTEEAEGWRHGR